MELNGRVAGVWGKGPSARHLMVAMAVATMPACCSQGSASARSAGAWGGIEE
jgi:hypothetical protein